MKDVETGEHVLGSIVCTWAYKYWLEDHFPVQLRYPLGPLIGYGEDGHHAALYWVYVR